MVVILVILTLVLFITLDYFVLHRESGATLHLVRPTTATDLFPVPPDVFLAQGHTWLRLAPSGEVRLGSAELPLRALGDVDRLELPLPGAQVERGERLAALWRGPRMVELRAPVSGTVRAVNSRVQADPSRMARDPFGDGWLCELAPRDLAAAVRRMFLAEDARLWLTREIVRLRDFLGALPARELQLAPLLPDGGVPLVGFGFELSDVEWRTLAERFFGGGRVEPH